jgi:TrpR family trp operon transcriptional repressor
MKNIKEISNIISSFNDEKEIYRFLKELFTEAELMDLSKRWEILKMLNDGHTQRDIASELKVSLCKVTRGAKIMKNKNAISTKYLKK